MKGWVSGVLARAGAVPGHRDQWVALTVGSTLASAAACLWWLVANADRAGLADDLPVAVVAACTHTALALLVAVRRRIDRPAGTVVVITLVVLMLAQGTAYTDSSMRWVCLAVFIVLPLLAAILLGRRGAVLTTAASMASALAVTAGLPGTGELRTYVAVTMTTLVCAPVLVVGVLVVQLQQARAAASAAAGRDELTGLLNRRGLLEQFPALLAEAVTRGERVTLVLVDLDHFKRVNDGWGHAAGDLVLVRTARSLSAVVRSEDLLVRHGGEELVWVARHSDPAEAAPAAERARAAVASAGAGDAQLPTVTASFGVAESGRLVLASGLAPDPAALLDRLLAAADAALYSAKEGGRDRVVVDGTGVRVPQLSAVAGGAG